MNSAPSSSDPSTGSSSSIVSSSTGSSNASTTTPTAFELATGSREPSGEDHLQRLAQMAQGVGKEDSDSTATSTPSGADGTLTYPGYVGSYPAAWQGYYSQFGQNIGTSAAAAAAFSWPAQCYAGGMGAWPNYAQSKKGRQTYQRYQTSVLEAKFQQSSYVSKKQREELRMQTNLTDRQIKIWFQNRRMKAKKEKHRLDEGGDHTALLPANPPKVPLLHPGVMHPAMMGGLVPTSSSLIVGTGAEDDDKKAGGWPMGMFQNPLAAAQHFPTGWPTAAQHPSYPMPYAQLCPPNL